MRVLQTLGAIAVVVCLVTLTPAMADEERHRGGARPPTAKELAYVEAIRQQVDTVAPNAFARARAADESAQSIASVSIASDRPTMVDNSTLPWFPPVGSQGSQNSCVPWAVGYYYNTYTQAMDAGVDASAGHPADLCSPAFLYPLVNDGADEGAYLDYTMARLSVIGCSSLALAPYNQTDYTSWPSEAAWIEALDARTESLYAVGTNTEAGLEALRQLLANGRLATILLAVYANLYYDYPHESPGIGDDVIYAPGGPYIFGHALTLVGYDDEREYTDARDGLLHRGAFLAVNSWGGSWGVANTGGSTGGFLWLAYDAFLGDNSFIYGAVYTDDREDYRPSVYALAGVSHPARGDLELAAGVGSPDEPSAVTLPVLDRSGGTSIGIESSNRIAVDLSEFVTLGPEDRLADVFVSLAVAWASADRGQIVSVEFRHDVDGDGSYVAASVPDLPVTVAAGADGYGFLPLFSDVNWENWAYESIATCYEAGIVGGYADGTYHPELTVTRDQMAVYLSRALSGGDEEVPVGPAAATFVDVPADHWAYDYIEYVASRAVVGGFADATYGPSIAVDRGQMAVFIARALADPTGDEGLASYLPPSQPTFPDVQDDFWAYRYIEYIAGPSVLITQGYGDGLYHPEYVCTRDQMAVYVARAISSSYWP